MPDETVRDCDISLLYPSHEHAAAYYASGEHSLAHWKSAVCQLELDRLLCVSEDEIAPYFTTDPDVIRYRQEVSATLSGIPSCATFCAA